MAKAKNDGNNPAPEDTGNATSHRRRRTRRDASSTAICRAPQGNFTSCYVHTPRVVDVVEVPPPVRTVHVTACRVGEALYEEVSKVTVGEIVFVVASLVSGKPVHVQRAADVIFDWACGVGLAVYQKVTAPERPQRGKR
jgi:hypothetical protein